MELKSDSLVPRNSAALLRSARELPMAFLPVAVYVVEMVLYVGAPAPSLTFASEQPKLYFLTQKSHTIFF